ncbi:MAG: hypothetical protein HYU88_07060, partial [Chloroflexi bacterium]|nr:hypothetical protein [Chloroflexota bacterium]
MAGTTVAWRTPDEFARVTLGSLGPGQRGLAFVFDPELLLSWPEDGSASITDAAEHVWRVLSYRGNDMALRARFEPGRSTVIWVRPRLLEGAESMDLTTLAEFVAQADAFVDASLAGMLGALLPGVPLPPEIAAWAKQAHEDPPGFARALGRVLKYRGKPVSRRHVLAAAVCQASARVEPAQAWLDGDSLPALLSSYLGLLATDRTERFRIAAGVAFQHVASLVGAPTASLKPPEVARLLAKFSADNLLDQFYVLAAARRHGVPSPIAAMANQGLAAPELTSAIGAEPGLSPILIDTVGHLNRDVATLEMVARDAERRLDLARLRQLQSLLAARAEDWAREPVAGVRIALLATVVEGKDFARDDLLPAPVEAPVGSPRAVKAAEGLAYLAKVMASYSTVPERVPEAASLDLEGLFDTYTRDLAAAEYDFVYAQHGLQSLVPFLGEQKKLSARLEALRLRCEATISVLDARLAELLQNNPALLASSPRSIHRWLPNRVVPCVQSEPGRRVWLLVFDGLRWDLWDRVLRRELEEAGWEVGVEGVLWCLPTETAICRRAL